MDSHGDSSIPPSTLLCVCVGGGGGGGGYSYVMSWLMSWITEIHLSEHGSFNFLSAKDLNSDKCKCVDFTKRVNSSGSILTNHSQ